MDKLRQEFVNPPLSLRGAPFWSWNDKLDPEELARQARDMKAHGMGGFFMHSREGLETEYMGPEWLECIRRTVQVAKAEGMGAWLYDEDRWPSGAAGGLVPEKGGDAFRAKVLTLEESDHLPKEDPDLLALFVAHLEGEMLCEVRRVDPLAPPALMPGDVYLVFRREVSAPSEWFNDDAYADNLNPEAVRAFLDITYETYREHVGQEFGKAVPGIFTDEPNIFAVNVSSGRRALPWTDGFDVFFQERRGYDLLDVVPWLFYEGDGAPKARHDYWYTISQRFTEAYSKQIGEWCERHGLAFTGHYLLENEMGMGILRGGAIMPHYVYQHVPGIDMLTEQTHEYLTVKQCSSVANQFGRKRVLSEMYGCTSWEFTFEGQKWVGDWQYVLGVSLRCQHLALYTLRGCRKRDYPPAFNYNTTWWKYNGVVEDYFARVGRVLTAGEAVRDVLVIHPVATGWMMLGEGEDKLRTVDTYGERLNEFVQALLATHYDFDFGDEQIMSAHAQLHGDRLQVGRAAYKVVVIPEGTRTLLNSTVDLLEAWLNEGGRVIVVGEPPAMIEAEPSTRLKGLFAHANVIRIAGRAELQKALEQVLPRRISLQNHYGQEAPSLLYMQRRIGDRQAFFVVNVDRDNGHDVHVVLEGSGRVEEWDPLTGSMRPLPVESHQDSVAFDMHIGPAGSKLYVIDSTQSPLASKGSRQPALFRVSRTRANASFIGPMCAFTRTDPNILTLDMCQYRMDGGEWSAVMEVWRAQRDIRQALGMRQVYYNGLPQRYKWARDLHPADGTPVALRFSFNVRDVPTTPVYLLVEGADQFEIRLNGESVPAEVVGWYLDRSFHKVALPPLKQGENILELACGYTNRMELEDCFLIGDFGVSIDRCIIREPERLHFGDWTTQGYPHYAGSMIYRGLYRHVPAEGERVRLYLGDYEAVHVAVYVNGELAGHIPWVSANGLDITDMLTPGDNAIDIEVVSSPRNMLGPLHLATGREPWTDWRSFRRTDETFTPEYVLKSWGLMGQVRIQRESGSLD